MASEILVPKGVSFKPEGKRGKRYEGRRGTMAFVPAHTRLPAGLGRAETRRRLRALAHKAEFFIKPTSEMQRQIRKLLEENGIAVEPELMQVGNGRALFAKKGHSLDSEEGRRIYGKDSFENLEKIQKLVAKMHALGVIHGHLHAGNIAITESGKIVLLDFNRATRLRKTRLNDGELRRLQSELETLGRSMTAVHVQVNPAMAARYATHHPFETFLRNAAIGVAYKYPTQLQEKITEPKFRRLIQSLKEMEL